MKSFLTNVLVYSPIDDRDVRELHDAERNPFFVDDLLRRQTTEALNHLSNENGKTVYFNFPLWFLPTTHFRSSLFLGTYSSCRSMILLLISIC